MLGVSDCVSLPMVSAEVQTAGGKVRRTIRSLQCRPTEGPTRGTIGQRCVSESGCGECRGTTYVGLEGRVGEVCKVCEVGGRGEGTQRALAGGRHGVWLCLAHYLDAWWARTVEEEAESSFLGRWHVVPSPGFWQ